MRGLYVEGTSILHRASPAIKLLLLALFTTLLIALASWVTVVIGAVVLVTAYALAGFAPMILVRQVWPLRWIILFSGVIQVLLAGWRPTVVTQGTLILAVGCAALVTLTTRTSALLESLDRGLQPLRRIGVRPERVALLLTLTIRVIPVIEEIAQQTMAARRARGVERTVTAFVTPVVIRTIGSAELLGEALMARGVDD